MDILFWSWMGESGEAADEEIIWRQWVNMLSSGDRRLERFQRNVFDVIASKTDVGSASRRRVTGYLATNNRFVPHA